MPDEFFHSLTFEEFEHWKIDGYLIPAYLVVQTMFLMFLGMQ